MLELATHEREIVSDLEGFADQAYFSRTSAVRACRDELSRFPDSPRN